MKPLSKETLERMMKELPSQEWSTEELEELVAPRYGIISGFQSILEDIYRLEEFDLEDIGPAGGPLTNERD